MDKFKFKSAFTLIELIFVIVIFAIISMFGSDLYTKIYDSYLQTRSMNQLEARTENALNLISARLEDRIRGTVIGRNSTDNSYVPIDSILENHDILEWIGQSVESKNLVGATAAGSIGWSGFVDIGSIPVAAPGFVSATDKTGASFSFITHGSNLSEMGEVIKNIKGNQNFGIIFKGVPADFSLATAYGYNGKDADKVAVATIDAANNNVINVTNYQGESDSSGGTRIFYSEQYYLAHSAYAIVANPINGIAHPQGGKVFDLELRYNYEPWAGQSYNGANVQSAVIAKDVSLFRFRDDDGAVAIKICMRDNGRNFDPTRLDLIVCKSQVVY